MLRFVDTRRIQYTCRADAVHTPFSRINQPLVREVQSTTVITAGQTSVGGAEYPISLLSRQTRRSARQEDELAARTWADQIIHAAKSQIYRAHAKDWDPSPGQSKVRTKR